MSTEYLNTDYEKLEYFVNLLKSRASGKDVPEREYIELREELLSNKILQSVLPNFVKTNGELNSFWRFIQDKAKGYSQRREFLTKEFEPIFKMLLNNQTSLSAIQKYVHTQASVKQELKEYFTSNLSLQNIYGVNLHCLLRLYFLLCLLLIIYLLLIKLLLAVRIIFFGIDIKLYSLQKIC